MRISDWSSDVCSSDLYALGFNCRHPGLDPGSRFPPSFSGTPDQVRGDGRRIGETNMQVYYERDADQALIKGTKVAAVGYVSQGNPHAQTIRASGVTDFSNAIRHRPATTPTPTAPAFPDPTHKYTDENGHSSH